MVTNADAKTPKEIDSIVVVARRGDSIVERIHGRGVEPERVVETAKTALTEAPRGALTDRPPIATALDSIRETTVSSLRIGQSSRGCPTARSAAADEQSLVRREQPGSRPYATP